MVTPVLLYGSELWGYEDTADLERLHLKFCKYILGIKSSTPNVMVYGELGRYPLSVVIKVRTVTFWYKLVNGKKSKFSHRIYSVLMQLYNLNIYKSPWLINVLQILNSCGLGNIWTEQGRIDYGVEWLKCRVKQVLLDQFQQQWYSDVRDSPKCFLYKEIKTELKIENYLKNLPRNVSRTLCKYNRLVTIIYQLKEEGI